ncbi:DUF4157 domain-containing protein [Undibacterium cyanobacteriorum]|uniref:DUF4157 domain-containing protein n=1 Tax=Undibacterium cyanobacteriorum TaxID=3073561 RepID=A0ABY9REK4_9BURK|nr:DUF4157 domain-containing protein [Undibacterium sp. 20NA77.5]WMW79652.1 DUF4157 domain-containing protein [Undibacterium sp. 20NA77.5]
MQTRTTRPSEQTSAQQASSSTQLKEHSLAALTDSRTSHAAQRRTQNLADASGVSTQLKMIQAKMQSKGDVAQRAEEEEPLQGKFETAQRVEEEEPLQGKFETAQRVEEEEPLQGKFETAQRAEEEEPLQGKFGTAQRVEEEEPLQGKFDAAQRKEEAKPNNTGLPNQLKAGIESLSGMSMDHVNVHYNSDKPARLNAHAYAQGSDIHVAPGQEQHLPHEAWHVVQQAQGRVKPTMQMKTGTPVNDDVGLETEADVMGAKALSRGVAQGKMLGTTNAESSLNDGTRVTNGRAENILDSPAQLKENVFITEAARRHYKDGWGDAVGVTSDSELKTKVPEDAAGEQTKQLGYVYAPSNEQTRSPKSGIKKAKTVTLGTKDGKYEGETMAVHCGPVGPAIEHYTDTGKRCPWN